MQPEQGDVWGEAVELLLRQASESSQLPGEVLLVQKADSNDEVRAATSAENLAAGSLFRPLTFASLLRALVLGSHTIPGTSGHGEPVFRRAYERAATPRSPAAHALTASYLVTCLCKSAAPLPFQCMLQLGGTERQAAASQVDTMQLPVQVPSVTNIAGILKQCIDKMASIDWDAPRSRSVRLELCFHASPNATLVAADEAQTGAGSRARQPNTKSIPQASIGPVLASGDSVFTSPLASARGRAPATPVDMANAGECSPWGVSDINPDGSLEVDAHARDSSLSPESVAAAQASTARGAGSPGAELTPFDQDTAGSTKPIQLPKTHAGRKKPALRLNLSPQVQPSRDSAPEKGEQLGSDSVVVRRVLRANSVASGISSVGSVRSQSQQEALLGFGRSPTADVSFELSPASVKHGGSQSSIDGFGADETLPHSKDQITPSAEAALRSRSSSDEGRPAPCERLHRQKHIFRLPLLAAKPQVSLTTQKAAISQTKSRLQTPLLRGLGQVSVRPRTAPTAALQVTPVQAVTVKDSLRFSTRRASGTAVRVRQPSESKPTTRCRPSPRAAKQQSQALSIAMANASTSARLHARAGLPSSPQPAPVLRRPLVAANSPSRASDLWAPHYPMTGMTHSRFGLESSAHGVHLSLVEQDQRRRAVHFAV